MFSELYIKVARSL